MTRILIALCLIASTVTLAYSPVKGRIMTPFGEKITPENAWREYPRPNMERAGWQCLNGLWEFEATSIAAEMPSGEKWQQEILVPFCPESALSGIGRLTDPGSTLWYRRNFNMPSVDPDRRYFLNFEAVDWVCQVWVNGNEITDAPHVGGNVPFSLEMTKYVKAGENTVVVSAWDPSNTEYGQPTGKQSLNPGGCFYTRVSGIYGSVWMESTPMGYIRGYEVICDTGKGEVTVKVDCAGDLADAEVDAEIYFGQDKVAKGEIDCWSKGATFKIKEPKLWDLGQPNLYTLKLTLEACDQKDTVTGYFGMRKVEFKKDERGVNRIYLNGRKVFMQGTLDQGWWPDGLLTPPSDEAMAYDIDLLKRHGFNFMRKHIKIEPRRYYYLCDKTGFVVWQDMVSGGQKPEQNYHFYRAELADMLKTLKNFPCIMTWIPYNEAWGQPDKQKTNATLKWVKGQDSQRFVSGASGWVDHGYGDIKDHHIYPSPTPCPTIEDRLVVLGEFGGLGYFVEGHLWDPDKKWGYRSDNTLEDSFKRYSDIMKELARTANETFAASVYTQTTDVETEANGLVTYDRKVEKYDCKKMAELHSFVERMALSSEGISRQCYLPSARDGEGVWNYTTEKPIPGWKNPDYDQSAWKQGKGAFGNKIIVNDLGAKVGTDWDTKDIWLRRAFEMKEVPEGDLEMEIFYDEDPEVYLNGVKIFKKEGYSRGYDHVVLNAETVKKAFKPGKNVLAVHCSNKNGGAMIDLGFYSEPALPEDK